MIEIIVALFLGIFLGVLSGTIPGLSPSKMLLLATVLISLMSPLQMAVLYISMMVVSQYVDAIPALYLGIPGEISAIPASKESKHIHDQGLISTTIKLTAIWRTLGTIIVVGLIWPFLDLLLSWPTIFSVKVQGLLLIIAVFGIWLTSDNRVHAIFLMIAGYLLGLVGYHFNLGRDILTFGVDSLHYGLPLVAVVMGLYVTPQAFKINFDNCKNNNVHSAQLSWTQVWEQRYIGIVSSVQGFFIGLVPGMSFILSSTACYNTAKYCKPNDSVSAVVASETGTTTGIIGSFLPLFLFGIPITLSESIIFSQMIDSGAMFSQGEFLFSNISILLITFIIVNIISLALSWPLAPKIMQVFRYLQAGQIRLLVVAISVLSVFVVGWNQQQILYYMVCYVIFTGIGFMLRKLELLPLIFIFALQNSIDYAVWTTVQIL